MEKQVNNKKIRLLILVIVIIVFLINLVSCSALNNSNNTNDNENEVVEESKNKPSKENESTDKNEEKSKTEENDKREEPSNPTDANSETSKKPEKQPSTPNNDGNGSSKPVDKQEEKPSLPNGGNNKPVEKPSKPSEPQEPTNPSHTHEYEIVYKTVYHEEEGHYEKVLIQEAWVEVVYENEIVKRCNQCGQIMRTEKDIDKHFLESKSCTGYSNYWIEELVDVIHHDAIYEDKWIVDKAAWDEQVVDYYQCNCGSKKFPD